MRLQLITGILLLGLGVFILFKAPSFRSEGTVNVGPIHSSVHERHFVPPLFGWVAIVGGVLLGIAGARKKR